MKPKEKRRGKPGSQHKLAEERSDAQQQCTAIPGFAPLLTSPGAKAPGTPQKQYDATASKNARKQHARKQPADSPKGGRREAPKGPNAKKNMSGANFQLQPLACRKRPALISLIY